MELLQINHISKKYGHKLVLDDINLKIKRGKIIGLLGPNGSGKTTLIKIINDLVKETSGNIKINGIAKDVNSKKYISYLPDRNYLNQNMKISELLDYFQDFYSDFRYDLALDLIKKLGLDKNSKLKTMSKGTKEKVQLILVMSRKTDLYILDEPIGGVDPASRDYIINTILSTFNENSTIIISTHLISDLENIFDDVIFLNNGKIKRYNDADTIRKEQGKSINDLFREEFKC